uniref:Uncharacterized protein n=1 Tax=Parascaris univalens TaxID=6257 RepID=A0A915A008_PARUN
MNLTPMIPLDGEVSVDPEAGYFATSGSPVASFSKSSTDDDVTQSTRSAKESEAESSSRGATIFERSSHSVINASKTAAKVTGKILCKTIASPVKMMMDVKNKCDEYRSSRDRKRLTSMHNKEQNQRKMHIPLFKSHHHVSDTSKGKQQTLHHQILPQRKIFDREICNAPVQIHPIERWVNVRILRRDAYM